MGSALSDLPLRDPVSSLTHLVASVFAAYVTLLLWRLARGDRTKRLSLACFGATAVVLYAASGTYHAIRLPTDSPTVELFRRLDHSAIYLLIAGTYTAVGLLSLHGILQKTVLAVVWAGALAATVVKFCWVDAPKWLSAMIGVALGWVGVAALPQLEDSAGPAAVALLAAGGVAYTVGAVVYARRRPDPVPAVFGYHELFHALTLLAIACQYVAIAFFVVRSG